MVKSEFIIISRTSNIKHNNKSAKVSAIYYILPFIKTKFFIQLCNLHKVGYSAHFFQLGLVAVLVLQHRYEQVYQRTFAKTESRGYFIFYCLLKSWVELSSSLGIGEAISPWVPSIPQETVCCSILVQQKRLRRGEALAKFSFCLSEKVNHQFSILSKAIW